MTITKFTSSPPSTASPVFNTNSSATTASGAIFTPDNVSATEWYAIDYSGSGTFFPVTGIQYSLVFDLTGVAGITYPDSLYILKRATFDDPWEAVSSAVIGSQISTGNLVGFGEFALGSTITANALPVNWLSFTGKSKNALENYLQWSTASEINNDHFVVERSTDMTNFAAIQKVKSLGNSSKTQSYSFTDKLKESATRNMYYRIKQVDLDGKSAYSNVVTIKQFIQATRDVTISNPFEGAPVIRFDNADNASALSIEVTDITGKVVMKQTYQLSEGSNTIAATEFNTLKNGIYFTQVKVDDTVLGTKKLLKSK
jgi:hypothetical protein